jgi:hypothetical protein
LTAGTSPGEDRILAAVVIAALSLATDLGLGIELEHGLRSTLFAMRLAERLGVDRDIAVQTYYACLLVHVGCTANAHVAAEVFGAGSEGLSRNLLPVLFGSQREMTGALVRTVAPGRPPWVRAAAIARAVPKAVRAGAGPAEPAEQAYDPEAAIAISERFGFDVVGPQLA